MKNKFQLVFPMLALIIFLAWSGTEPASSYEPPKYADYFSNPEFQIYEIQEKHHKFFIPYKISGANLSSMDLDCDGHEIIIGIESSDGGTLVVNIPRKMLDTRFNGSDDEFFVILDGKEIVFDEIYSDVESRTLEIPFSKDSQVLEIIIAQLISQEPKNQVTCGDLGPDESPYYNLLSPLKQFKYGIPIAEIQCKEGLVFAQKGSNGNPICITPQTKAELIKRDWLEQSRPPLPDPDSDRN